MKRTNWRALTACIMPHENMMKTGENRWLRFMVSERYANFGLLLLRLLAGGMMLTHGIAKLENFTALREGFPDPIGWGVGVSLVMIILVEVGCSLLVMSGFLTRFAVLPLIFAMVVAITTHSELSFGSMELPLLYIGMYIVIFVTGPGRCSIDYLIDRVSHRPEA